VIWYISNKNLEKLAALLYWVGGVTGGGYPEHEEVGGRQQHRFARLHGVMAQKVAVLIPPKKK
jgi:hypothetical protein